jgi:spore coat polysaccharide biosynthesis protein SpsF
MDKFNTAQEIFWAGQFGTDYISRNNSQQLLASNLSFFSKALKQTGSLSSCIEFGANIGMNLKAINLLFPKIQMKGIEINAEAAEQLRDFIGESQVFEGSILAYEAVEKFDLVLIKTVLIHINPEKLGEVYEKLYNSSQKYILVCEYYNPSPVTINYRGHNDRLFKRDFAGEMLEMYKDLVLVDYGFAYKRDRSFPQDDITWFLMEKV